VEFGLFGYHGASTSSIAARADVPQPHVYANFETKQQLFLACFERLGEQLSVRPSEAPSESLLRFLYQSVASSSARCWGSRFSTPCSPRGPGLFSTRSPIPGPELRP
jgi:AcrR family transcriptional regulator